MEMDESHKYLETHSDIRLLLIWKKALIAIIGIVVAFIVLVPIVPDQLPSAHPTMLAQALMALLP